MNWDPPTEDIRLRDDGFDEWLELYGDDLGLGDMDEGRQRARFQQWVRDAQWQDGEDLAQARYEAMTI